LWFDGYDTTADPTKCGSPVADMSADVEDQIAGPYEMGIEPVHPPSPSRAAVINPKRASDPHASQ
jgi:hypothetical protein